MNQYSEALRAMQHEADEAEAYAVALLNDGEEYDEDFDDAEEDDEEQHGPCAICGDRECSADQHEDEWDDDGNWTGF